MTPTTASLLSVLIFAVAMLYSTVGHAGASGYLAAMALLGIAPSIMQPTSLALNIVVASIAAVQFARAGHFRWALFWPFAVAAAPAAYLGGLAPVPAGVFRGLVGAALVFSAWWMARRAAVEGVSINADGSEPAAPSVAVSLLIGAAIGFLSGLSGTGGGIFLSPLLLLRGWASVKRTAATSAGFILVNSVAGLAGLLGRDGSLPPELLRYGWAWALAAVAGGVVGSSLGAWRLRTPALCRLLAVVLLIAGVKLLATR